MTTRSMPKRRGAAVLAAVAVTGLVTLSACGGSTQPAAGSDAGSGSGSSNKTLVFSPLALQIPAMKQLSEGIQAYAKSKGYSVIVQDPNLDPQKQVTDLQSVVESGRAAAGWGIMVQPSAASALVKQAQSKGVPLVLNGVPSDYGLSGLVPGVSFATIDYKAEGVSAGTELGNCINEKLGGKAEVLFGESQAGTAGKADYENAVKETLAKTAPDAKIVSTITIKDRSGAQTDVGNALQGHPGINAVFAQNDEGALGTIGAFKAAGKKVPCITETGGNDEALAAAKSGDIYAVVALQFAQDMTQNVDTLLKMIEDPKATGVQLTTPQKVVKAGS
ncbi:sugar ABC transporter substrate-binding protein [Nocardioides sp. CER19]|uniref:sugar ABC transporter substrate-binding protein n=1 Tax=Nocardioides sp. CER19 TaxID=3038538 RepID=UPI002447C025|nr:sugar ABC transporter substrate-binding protein [Nocardioides sp. CER19]MDH2413132.1 sugar ABC transporter substrate-binding protein [Nocardioides sp. CER19]